MALSISHASSSTLYRVPPSCGPTTSLASILSLACTHFNVSPSDHDLQQTLPNKSVKWVDPTLTLRLANFKHGTKLALVRNTKKAAQDASSSTPVRIALELSGGGGRVESSFPPSTSLWSVLCAMESEHSLQLTTLVSVPPPERGTLFELTINIPGYMQPVVDFMQQRCDTIEKLQETTLAQLGITKGAAKLKVTHKYIPPHMTPQQQQHVLQQFNETWNKRQHEFSSTTLSPDTSSATATSTSTSTSTPTPVPTSSPSPTPPASVVIPADRNIRAWYASVGVLRPDVLPDSFYEPTQEDAQMYARAIQAEATAAKAALLAERVHKKQATSTDEKGTAAPSSSPDLSSSSTTTTSSSSHASRWSFNNSFSSKRGTDFGVALLKLRFPNHIYVQAMFRSDETLADVHTWCKTHVLDPSQLQAPAPDDSSPDTSTLSSSSSTSISTSTSAPTSSSSSSTSVVPYELFITPPRTVLRDDPHMTLAQAQLVPAASIHFKSIIHTAATTPTFTQNPTVTVTDDTAMTDIKPSPGTGLLLPQLINKLIILPSPAPAPAPASATPSTMMEDHLHPAGAAPANIDQSTVSTSNSSASASSASSSSSASISDVPLSGTT